MGRNLISCYNAYFCFRKWQHNEEVKRNDKAVPELAKMACGEAGLLQRVMNLCSRWKCVVNFTIRPLYPATAETLVRIEREAGWPQNHSRCFGEEKNLVLRPIKPRFLGHPTCCLFKLRQRYLPFLF